MDSGFLAQCKANFLMTDGQVTPVRQELLIVFSSEYFPRLFLDIFNPYSAEFLKIY